MPSSRTELQALRNLISEADLILETAPPLPQNRSAAARATCIALALVDDLTRQTKMNAAAVLGKRGGSAIAKRGPDYFRQLAAKRKTRAGGRPRKQSYELLRINSDRSNYLVSDPTALPSGIGYFYEVFELAAIAINFKGQCEITFCLGASLRAVFHRSVPYDIEIGIWRTVLSAHFGHRK
jgi:hypothetical protein